MDVGPGDSRAEEQSLGTVQFERARLVVGALVEAGVRRAITSPGSRSTPLVLAMLELADPGRASGPDGLLEVRSIADERAAAFFALGQARATGAPTVLVCTSGSAPAHYLPAILEAREARLPLIVASADRPRELMDCGAPQTTDQTKLFGGAVNHFAEIDLAGRVDRASLRALRRNVVQAVHRARWTRPGVVHLNVRASKPLEPVAGVGDRKLGARVDEVLSRPLGASRTTIEPDLETVERAAALCAQAERGLIVAGALPLPLPARRRAASGSDPFALLELARSTGFPLLAEATSQSRFQAGAVAADGDVRLADRLGAAWAGAGFDSLPLPDLVVQVGAPPVSAGTQALMRLSGAPQIVLSDGPWTDPDGLASLFLFGRVERTSRALCERLGDALAERRGGCGSWRQALDGLCARLRDATAAAGPRFHDGAAARVVVRAMPTDGLLMLGNSLSVRLVETWAERLDRRVWVASQRGLSGIDGLVAGFLGSVSCGGFDAGLLLVGDVSVVHDLDGFAAASTYGDGPPAVVVVIDNGGGRIFEHLPVAATDLFRGEAGKHWLTPPDVDLVGMAKAFRLPCARAEDEATLEQAIAAGLGRRGVSIVVAAVEEGQLAAAEKQVAAALATAAAG